MSSLGAQDHSWERWEPILRPLQGPQTGQGLYACDPILGSARLCLGPWVYGARSHSSHEGTFVLGWMLNWCHVLTSLPVMALSCGSSWFQKRAPVDQCRNLLYDTEKRLLDSLLKKDTSQFTFMYKIERSIPVKQETSSTGSHVTWVMILRTQRFILSDLRKFLSLRLSLHHWKTNRWLELTTQVNFRVNSLLWNLRRSSPTTKVNSFLLEVIS